MPVVAVAGSAIARGHQHGETLRAKIGDCIDVYDATFKLSDAQVAERAAPFEGVTRSWHAELATEIDAIAEASGHPKHWLWALNARSEIMSFTGAEVSECTSVWSPGPRILAQNWDWMSGLEPLTVVLDAIHPDGHQVVTVTEPGIVGKVGMSSAGIGVGLNFLYSPEALTGVPVHVLLRALLDARSRADVEHLVATAGSGRSAHVFLAGSDGLGSSLEYTGSQMWRVDATDEPLLHTNHFVNRDAEAAALPQGAGADNSEARYDRSVAVVADGGVATESAVRGLLDDRGHAEFPICRPYAPSATLPDVETGTICAIVMRLADGEMDVRLGPDPAGSWQTHSVGAT